MDLPTADQDFLRDFVKQSRQRPHHVAWVDRDGSGRITTATQTEIVRLNALAQRLRIGKVELLRQAAHLPVLRKSPGNSSQSAVDSAVAAPAKS